MNRRIITITDPDVQVVVFNRRDGSAQAVVTNPLHPDKPSVHEIPLPEDGFRVVTTRYPTGEVEISIRAEVDAVVLGHRIGGQNASG